MLARSVFLISLVMMLANCTHLQSVSTSSIPQQRATKVVAERSKFIFLMFNFNNDYVNDMAEDLARQCPNGKVQGILTKQEFVTYFPLFFNTSKVTAEGYCVGGGKTAGL